MEGIHEVFAVDQLRLHPSSGLYQRLTMSVQLGLNLCRVHHGALNFLAQQLSVPLAQPVDEGSDGCHAHTKNTSGAIVLTHGEKQTRTQSPLESY
jgi:hypothetical protein